MRRSVHVPPFLMSRTEIPLRTWVRWPGHRTLEDDGEVVEGGTDVAERMPVRFITWDWARRFCVSYGWDLPTESEWEFACRALTTTANLNGQDLRALTGFANLRSYEVFHPDGVQLREDDPVVLEFPDGSTSAAAVGSYAPNGFGLYDMIGNVSEWCRDESDDAEGTLTFLPDDRPREDAAYRIVRGGSFRSGTSSGRCAVRWLAPPNSQEDSIGFRAVVELTFNPAGIDEAR